MMKSRDLTIVEFFNKLQEEYIIAELRRKIYPKIKDKRFWEKVMEGKHKKINDISLRNSLPNIFNNEAVKAKKYAKIYNETGFPNFIYKDCEDETQMAEFDKKYYYNVGSQVRVFVDGELLIGKIDLVDFEVGEIVVDLDNDKRSFDIKSITRIL